MTTNFKKMQKILDENSIRNKELDRERRCMSEKEYKDAYNKIRKDFNKKMSKYTSGCI